MQNLLIIVQKFKAVVISRLEPIVTLFISFLVVSVGVLGYSLLRAEK